MSKENAPARPLRWTVPVNMAPNVTQSQGTEEQRNPTLNHVLKGNRLAASRTGRTEN